MDIKEVTLDVASVTRQAVADGRSSLGKPSGSRNLMSNLGGSDNASNFRTMNGVGQSRTVKVKNARTQKAGRRYDSTTMDSGTLQQDTVTSPVRNLFKQNKESLD